MNRLVPRLILLSAFLFTCGSTTQPIGKEPKDKYVTLSGVVMDASYAVPVVDAIIRFQRLDGAYTVERKTDVEGKFFSLIGYVDSCEIVNDYHVQVIKENYVTKELMGGIDFQCVDENQNFIVDLYRTEDYGKENQIAVYGKTIDGITQNPIGGVHIQVYMYYQGREECEALPIIITHSRSDSLNLGQFYLTYSWQWCTRDLYIICNAQGYQQTVFNYGLLGSQLGEIHIGIFLYPAETL